MSVTTIGAIVRGDMAVFPPFLYEAYRSTLRRAPVTGSRWISRQ